MASAAARLLWLFLFPLTDRAPAVRGILKGWDPLVNLVLDETIEELRGTYAPGPGGLFVGRGGEDAAAVGRSAAAVRPPFVGGCRSCRRGGCGVEEARRACL